MINIRRASAIGAAVTATACAAMALAPAAVAAEPTAQRADSAKKAAAAQYNGACGSGYSVVNSAQIGTKGTVFLTYSSATGKNCVVTVRTKPGKAVHMTASLGFAAPTPRCTSSTSRPPAASPARRRTPSPPRPRSPARTPVPRRWVRPRAPRRRPAPAAALAATGSSSATGSIALAGGAAVLLGAAAVFVVRRRKAGSAA
ncbi:hypothetical protein SCALM49S_01532 [Streptomyces californicus]